MDSFWQDGGASGLLLALRTCWLLNVRRPLYAHLAVCCNDSTLVRQSHAYVCSCRLCVPTISSSEGWCGAGPVLLRTGVCASLSRQSKIACRMRCLFLALKRIQLHMYLSQVRIPAELKHIIKRWKRKQK